MFFNVRKKLPVLKGFRTCVDNKKSLLHLSGQSRSRGHPSVKFSLRPARPLSLLGLLSALRLPQARPQRRFVSFFTSRLQTLRRIHFFDVRRRILFFTAPAAAARPTLINKKFSSVQILPLLAGNIPNLSLDLRARQMLHDICLKTRATFPFAAAKLQVRKAFFPYSCQQQKERFPYAAGHLSWRRSLPGR